MAAPDAVIVGAGVMGLACAFELSRRGQSVLILERGRAGDGCSAVGGGFVCRAAQVSREMGQLVRESQQRYGGLADELGGDLGLRACGSLVLAADDDEAALLRRRLERGDGGELEWLEPAEVFDAEPLLAPTIAGALHQPGDLQIDPRRLMAAYRAAAAGQGAELREQHTVLGLRRDKQRVVGVQTRLGIIDAGTVILTCGCWTPALLPHSHAALVRPRRGQMLVARPRRRCYQRLLLGADYLASKRGQCEVGFSLEQTVDGVVRAGGSREWVGFDTRPTELIGAIEANLPRYVKLADDLTWSHALAALRPATSDGLPLIGQLERGLYLAVGHEGNGFATAPATAARLAANVLGEPSELRAFAPGRFMTPPEAQIGSSTTFGSPQSRGPEPISDWD